MFRRKTIRKLFLSCTSRLLTGMCGTLFLVLAPLSQTQAQEPYTSLQLERAQQAVFDELDNPWYKTELVLFERLQVLPFNTEENLIELESESWPAGITLLRSPTEDASNVAHANSYWRDDLSRCFGFPMFADKLPTHPATGKAMSPPLPPDYQQRQLANSDELDPPSIGIESPAPAIADIQPTPTIALTEREQQQQAFKNALHLFEQQLIDQSLAPLEEFALSTEVKLINRRSHLRPLKHLSWLQVPAERSSPNPLWITAPGNSENERITGTFGVTLGRYLHFAIDLRYSTATMGFQPVPITSDSSSAIPTTGHIRFKQSRRMRSGELHYLDHPKLGVIVRIDPVTIPTELIYQWLELRQAK